MKERGGEDLTLEEEEIERKQRVTRHREMEIIPAEVREGKRRRVFSTPSLQPVCSAAAAETFEILGALVLTIYINGLFCHDVIYM